MQTFIYVQVLSHGPHEPISFRHTVVTVEEPCDRYENGEVVAHDDWEAAAYYEGGESPWWAEWRTVDGAVSVLNDYVIRVERDGMVDIDPGE